MQAVATLKRDRRDDGRLAEDTRTCNALGDPKALTRKRKRRRRKRRSWKTILASRTLAQTAEERETSASFELHDERSRGMSDADVFLLAPATGLYDFIAAVSLEAIPRG